MSAAPFQPSQPMQPQQPMRPPGPRGGSRRVWPWVLGGVAALLALITLTIVALLVLFYVLRSTPEDAIANYETSIRENDCELFQEVTLEEYREAVEMPDCATFTAAESPQNYDLEIGEITQESGVAEVTVTQTWDYQGTTYTAPGTVILVVQGGEWKVADYGLTEEPTPA